MKIRQLTWKETSICLWLLAQSICAQHPDATQHPDADINHVVIYGQSLSTGYQSVPPISRSNYGGNLMLGKQVWANMENDRLTSFDPLVSNVAAFYNLSYEQSLLAPSSSPASCECPVTGFVNSLKYLIDKQNGDFGDNVFLASSCGAPGQSIELLSKHCSNPNAGLYTVYTSALKAARAVAKNKKKSLVCPAILWMQGESNYSANAGQGLLPGTNATAGKEAYKQLSRQLADDMTVDVMELYGQALPPLFLTYQTTGQYTRGHQLTIGMAQLELSNEQNGILCAGPVYQMTDRGGHLDPNGYRWFGELMSKVYYLTVIEGHAWAPLQPKQLNKGINYVIISYQVPVSPLVLDTHTLPNAGNFGFCVYENGRLLPIASVELISGHEIKITTKQDFAGDIEIVYAGEAQKGHGNLRDSDPFESMALYEELPDTQKSAYEPTDEGGNKLYGKKYPLHNYSLAFNYKMTSGCHELIIDHLPASLSTSESLRPNGLRMTGHNNICLSSDLNCPFFIVDSNGSIRKTGNLIKGENEITVQGLPSGIYVLSTNQKKYKFRLED